MLVDVCKLVGNGGALFWPEKHTSISRTPVLRFGRPCFWYKNALHLGCQPEGTTVPYIIEGKTVRRKKIKCNQCVMVSINGVACHEHGCPNKKRTRR